jgi:hypothetical protein
MPARYVGPYAERDAAATLALFESLDPVLDREGIRQACTSIAITITALAAARTAVTWIGCAKPKG